jgi:hypothetical protein
MIHHRRGARAVCATTADVANQRRRREFQGVYFANRVLLAAWYSLVFEFDLAVLGRACSSRMLRKSTVLLLDQRSPFTDANDRCVARRTVGLSACSYLCHVPKSEGSRYS